jgi:hypothetical protein
MSRPGIEPRASTVGGEHSIKEPVEQLTFTYELATQEKSNSNSLLIAIRNIYI